MKTTIIKTLGEEFREFLESDSVTLPEGSEDAPASAQLSDDEDNASDNTSSEDNVVRSFAFPVLDAQIRSAISSYGAVFPKLNWTSPQDASWILAPSSPLKCTSPADVYLFLKSSDFVIHDLDASRIFEGCNDISLGTVPTYELELVLKKWFVIEKSREVRCFVRNNVLIGVSQRDPNYYEFLNEPSMHETIRQTTIRFWDEQIRPLWTGGRSYVFDLLLTRDLSRAHIVDFNPYAPRTDALLFTYSELFGIYKSHIETTSPDVVHRLPVFRVIDSRAHPSAARNSPQNAHNMVPREALEMSEGRNMDDFSGAWTEELRRAMGSDSDSGGDA